MGRPVITGARVAAEWWTTMTDPDEGEITLPGAPVGAPGSVKIISPKPN
jgi:hypothetical protein